MPQTVQCPQCKGAVAVRDEAAGRRVKCPKCGKEFLAPGFAPSENDDDDWLVLDHERPASTAPAVTAKSTPPPLQRGGSSTTATSSDKTGPPLGAQGQAAPGHDDPGLDDFTSHVEPLPSAAAENDNLLDDLPPLAPPPATPQAEDVEYETEYRVKCNVCGSVLYAKATQQGKTITCGDCYSEVTVPAPPKKKKKPQLSVENAQVFGMEQATTTERVDPFRKSAEELLQEAEKAEEEEPEPTFDTPDIREWVLNVFGVFFDPGVLAHWLGLSMIASFPVYFALWLESPALMPVLFVGAIIFAALVVACGFAIMISVANNNKTVSEWPTLDPMGWFEQLFFAFAAAALAAFPALAVGQAFLPPMIAIAVLMFSIYALFPFFILSMLDMDSVMMPFSPEVARSVTRCQESWGGFYFSSGLLFACLFLFYTTLYGVPPAGAAVVGIFATVAVAFMYFAMIGRLAYSIGQEVNDPPRKDDVDKARPTES